MVNNPTETALTDAHLFLEFIDPDGNVVSEVPATTNLPAGPSVVPVAWDSGSFSPAYDPAKDYIVMAFLTDYQGNILDTAARPSPASRKTPSRPSPCPAPTRPGTSARPSRAHCCSAPSPWAASATVDLLTYLGTTSGMTVAGSTSRSLSPGDTATYTVTLNTQALRGRRIQQGNHGAHQRPGAPGEDDYHPGERDRHAARRARWRDPPAAGCAGDGFGQPGRLGGVHAHAGTGAADAAPGQGVQPGLRVAEGRWQIRHAVRAGTASYDMFGDGRDGVMPSSGNLDNNNGVGVGVVNNGSQGSYSVSVTDAYGVGRINPGDAVLIHQTQGTERRLLGDQ